MVDPFHSLHQRLAVLEQQKQKIEEEILSIRKEIETQSPFSKTQKIELFHGLFIGNEEVYAKHWVSKDGSKKGYSPVSRTFRGTDYLPVTHEVILRHLEGKIRIGTYAVRHQSMCRFLAIDLDKASYINDARAIKEVCLSMQISPYFELSKSGNGIHIWFFFVSDVRARDARILGDIIISKAMDYSDGIDMKSYDRLFPNQDYVAPDALGNLIALPLHYGSRSEGKTLFIDMDTMQPYPNQWELLHGVNKIETKHLLTLTAAFNKLTEQSSLMPWEVKQEQLLLPQSVTIVLFDALYIEKTDLSKSFLNLLKRMASFYNPEFYIRQQKRFSTYNTPRIVSTYDLNERYIILPRGLYAKLKVFFKKHHTKIQVEDKRLHHHIDSPTLSLSLRSEQRKAMDKILKMDYALLVAPPGFGKTAVASAVIAKRSVSTLILVHKTTLLDQWVTRLSEYFEMDSKNIGVLGKGKKKLNGNFDVATLQSLKNRPELIEAYTQIVVDEAHHIPAVSFEVALKRFRGKYVLGLSATPKRQDGMEVIMYLQCGDLAYQAVRNTTMTHQLKIIPTAFESYSDHFGTILSEIIEDDTRNQLIIDEVEILKTRKVLILSERIEHLNRLWHQIHERNIEAILIHGGLSSKEKRKQFEKATQANIILSTSSYIGEGVDMGHLDTIIFTMPISYPERIIQYLGRIGREGQECLAIDFIDVTMPMLKRSFTKRSKGYKKMGYVQLATDRLF